MYVGTCTVHIFYESKGMENNMLLNVLCVSQALVFSIDPENGTA